MDLQQLAAQLRKPEGPEGSRVGAMMNQGNRAINSATIESLQVQDGQSILEIGMGNGGLLDDLFSAARALRYTGIDYAPLMVAEARERHRGRVQGGSAQFLEGDAACLPFEGASFDRVFTVNTIYFWEDPFVHLAEIRRVLKKEGIFSIGIRTRKTMDSMPFTAYGFTKYDTGELERLLGANGFSIISSREVEEPPYTFEGRPMILRNGIISCRPGPSASNDSP